MLEKRTKASLRLLDMSELAFKVPDCLCSAGIDFIQEATTVAPVKNPGKTPRLVLEWLHIHDFDK
jgi:hypothetical protein